MIKVACSEFVKRQTKESGFSHFSGTWEVLEALVNVNMLIPGNVKPGYKDGVILVKVPAEVVTNKWSWYFYSAIVDVTPLTKLSAHYAPRMPGEDPHIRVAAKAKKQKAKYVEIVCYRHDVLEEDNDRSTDAEWEIICIKARTSEEEEPMDPYTMARNFLHMKGGTKANFTPEQFAKSIVYWNNHCMTLKKRTLWGTFKHWINKLLNKDSK